MAILFRKGISMRKIAKHFGCSITPIRNFLITFFDKNEYETYWHENRRRNMIKRNRSKKGRATSIKNGQKAQKIRTEISARLPRSLKQKEQIKNWQKAGQEATRELYVSSWEDKFFLICLTKMFFSKDIKRQFYLKGLNHAFDFAIPEFKILFEIDGDYWHNQSERKKRDAKIDNFVNDTDWILFRYNDEDLKKLEVI